jgi:hypothetical protein
MSAPTAEQAKIAAAPDGVSDHAMTGAWRVIIARKGEQAQTWYYHSADDHRHKAALRQQADEWFSAREVRT